MNTQATQIHNRKRKDHYGNTIYEDVPAPGNAADILLALDIPYDRVIYHYKTTKNQWGYVQEQENIGLHYYFMRGDHDVSYWTPTMNSLFILEKPRRWGAEALEDTKEFWMLPRFPKKI